MCIYIHGFLYHSNEAYFNEGQEHGKISTAKIVWKYIHLHNFRMHIQKFSSLFA